MPFFARQKVVFAPFEMTFHKEQSIDDDGNVTDRVVPDNEPLPDIALFDLKAQIKAGVNQHDVSTKILGSSLAVSEAIEALGKTETQTK